MLFRSKPDLDKIEMVLYLMPHITKLRKTIKLKDHKLDGTIYQLYERTLGALKNHLDLCKKLNKVIILYYCSFDCSVDYILKLIFEDTLFDKSTDIGKLLISKFKEQRKKDIEKIFIYLFDNVENSIDNLQIMMDFIYFNKHIIIESNILSVIIKGIRIMFNVLYDSKYIKYEGQLISFLNQLIKEGMESFKNNAKIENEYFIVVLMELILNIADKELNESKIMLCHTIFKQQLQCFKCINSIPALKVQSQQKVYLCIRWPNFLKLIDVFSTIDFIITFLRFLNALINSNTLIEKQVSKCLINSRLRPRDYFGKVTWVINQPDLLVYELLKIAFEIDYKENKNGKFYIINELFFEMALSLLYDLSNQYINDRPKIDNLIKDIINSVSGSYSNYQTIIKVIFMI